MNGGFSLSYKERNGNRTNTNFSNFRIEFDFKDLTNDKVVIFFEGETDKVIFTKIFSSFYKNWDNNYFLVSCQGASKILHEIKSPYYKKNKKIVVLDFDEEGKKQKAKIEKSIKKIKVITLKDFISINELIKMKFDIHKDIELETFMTYFISDDKSLYKNYEKYVSDEVNKIKKLRIKEKLLIKTNDQLIDELKKDFSNREIIINKNLTIDNILTFFKEMEN